MDDDRVENGNQGLLSRIGRMMEHVSSQEEQEALVKDMNRMLRMFYLEMRVKGKLAEFKNDYFA